MAPLNLLIEVNIDGESSKSGVAPDDLEALARAVEALPNVRLRGLMAIPAPAATREGRLRPLAAMRANVTSKGGTTAKALEVLDARDIDGIVDEAVEAARRRSVEMKALFR